LASAFGGAFSVIRSWHFLQTNLFSAATKLHSSDLSTSQKKQRRRLRGSTVSSKGSFSSVTAKEVWANTARESRREGGVRGLERSAKGLRWGEVCAQGVRKRTKGNGLRASNVPQFPLPPYTGRDRRARALLSARHLHHFRRSAAGRNRRMS
jgi:hypothetical protein